MDTVERIFELLIKSGTEQKVFASAIGTTENKISEWKARKTKAYVKYLPEIADYFGVSIDYLLGKTDIKNKPTNTKVDELTQKLFNITAETISAITPIPKDIYIPYSQITPNASLSLGKK